MTEQDIARAVRLYNKGRTLREIAAELGVDSKTVWQHLNGRVQTRRRGPRGRADVTDELIVELRDEAPPGGVTMSWPEIAREVGMSRTGVRARYLRATTGTRWR